MAHNDQAVTCPGFRYRKLRRINGVMKIGTARHQRTAPSPNPSATSPRSSEIASCPPHTYSSRSSSTKNKRPPHTHVLSEPSCLCIIGTGSQQKQGRGTGWLSCLGNRSLGTCTSEHWETQQRRRGARCASANPYPALQGEFENGEGKGQAVNVRRVFHHVAVESIRHLLRTGDSQPRILPSGQKALFPDTQVFGNLVAIHTKCQIALYY